MPATSTSPSPVHTAEEARAFLYAAFPRLTFAGLSVREEDEGDGEATFWWEAKVRHMDTGRTGFLSMPDHYAAGAYTFWD